MVIFFYIKVAYSLTACHLHWKYTWINKVHLEVAYIRAVCPLKCTLQ